VFFLHNEQKLKLKHCEGKTTFVSNALKNNFVVCEGKRPLNSKAFDIYKKQHKMI